MAENVRLNDAGVMSQVLAYPDIEGAHRNGLFDLGITLG